MNSFRKNRAHPRTETVQVGRLPDFMIIGARRSGTSSLSAYLRSHPSVFVARNKEVHYFDRYLEKGLDWYRDQFVGASKAHVIGEATPVYMYEPQIPELMTQTVPDAKLIAILRDPVERAYSHYWYNRGKGYERLPFEEAIRLEPDRLISGDPNAVRYSYLSAGHYFEQLQRVSDFFSRERLLVLLTEDLARNPAETFAELCRFLEVDQNFVPPIIGERRNRPFRSRKLRAVGKRMPSRSRRLIERVNTRSSYPPMPYRVREELINHYAPHDSLLSSWLGRDLSMWSSIS